MPKKKLKTRTKVRPKAKPAKAKPANAKPAKAKRSSKARPKPRKPATRGSKWVRLVEKNGVMLASARGAVPNIAEVVAGAPIIGGWWAHPKGKAIFAALSEIDDSDAIRCFKLIDGKITLAAVQQEHLPTGEHRNFITPFPDWVDDATAKAADKLTLAAAKKLVAI